MARVGFIGTGQIATAMVRGLVGHGHEIHVSDRNPHVAAELSAEFPSVTVASNHGVVKAADIVFLCLPGELADKVLPSLPFRAGQSVVSVMMGVPRARLIDLCGPADDIAITIPLPGIACGGCPLPVYPASPALESLFAPQNPVFVVDSEAALSAHFGATALSSPLLAMMARTTAWLAQYTGDPLQAEAYVVAMIRSQLAERPIPHVLAQTLMMLSTEGGLNAMLRDHMKPSYAELDEGLEKIGARLKLKSPLAG